MRRHLATGLLIGWLLGIGTGLFGLAITSGWYEYRFVQDGSLVRMINDEGWQVVPGQSNLPYLRRPRFRLPHP